MHFIYALPLKELLLWISLLLDYLTERADWPSFVHIVRVSRISLSRWVSLPPKKNPIKSPASAYSSCFSPAASSFSKKATKKSKNCYCSINSSSINNDFHNILRLFDVLPNFSFVTSETMRDQYLYHEKDKVNSRLDKTALNKFRS